MSALTAVHQSGAQALRAAIPRLREAGVEDAARDARALLAHAMALPEGRLTLHLQDDLTPAASALFAAHVAARLRRQPVSQIIGRREFWGLSFAVTTDVLDPRPETEVLVGLALSRPFARMLDLGTGSGAILLSCLAHMPMASGLGVDLSQAALDVAQRNAAALGLSLRAGFARSDWFSAVEGRYDLIASNPPYIALAEMAGLAPEVRDFEPHLALTPGGDGLEAYRAISRGAPSRLMPGGRLLLEIGPAQGAAVRAMLETQGLLSVQVHPDLDGRDRVVSALAPMDDNACGSA